MSGEQVKVEMMRQYPIPGTPEEGKRYFFFGWTVFLAAAVFVVALTLIFVR